MDYVGRFLLIEPSPHCITQCTDFYLDACAAGLVLIVARSCPDLWQALNRDEIAALWDKCQSILQDQALFSASARKSLDLLLKVNEHALLKQAASETENQGGSGVGGSGLAGASDGGRLGEGGGERSGGNGSYGNNTNGLASQLLSGADTDGLAAVGGSNVQPSPFDFLAQMADPNAPSLLEDTYAMGPLFAWDQNIDFTNLIP